MFWRFTNHFREAMALANEEAHRLNHEYIGTEHILLGLVKHGSGTAVSLLKRHDIDLDKIRLEVEKLVKPGREIVSMSKLPQNPRAKKVIDQAIMESLDLHHRYVGTEHLLLGLLSEPDGVAGQVLMKLGVRLADVRNGLSSGSTPDA